MRSPRMQLVSSRTIPFIDSETLTPRHARGGPPWATNKEGGDGFVLYLANGHSSTDEERVMFLDLREALLWLNESSEQHGSFWT